jgi:hypothetical protein
MCNTELDALRSYHVIDPTTLALVLRSGTVLFLKSICCLWTLLGGAALLIEFIGRRAFTLRRIRRVAGDTRLTMHKTGWRLRRLLAPMLVALLLLSGAASGNDQVLGKPLPSAAPKSKTAAAAYSLVTTLVPEGISILFLAQEGNHSQARNRTWFALGLSGPVFGPGVGHLYADNSKKFNNGTLLRLGLSTLGVTALYSSDESDFAGVIALSSGAIVAFSMIYDIATVGKSVDKFNHGHGFSDLRITPTYFVSHKAPGVMLTLSF